MIYQCYNCKNISFKKNCPTCNDGSTHLQIPLDPSFYPEFQYQSEGFIKDLFTKKKEEERLTELLDNILKKYEELKYPYFVNFIKISKYKPENLDASLLSTGPKTYSEYQEVELFLEVLLRNGFRELKKVPILLDKLLLTTSFESEYVSFSNELKKHIKDNLQKTLISWIKESGTNFRRNLPLFLYYLWEHNIPFIEIHFNEVSKPHIDLCLVDNKLLDKIFSLSEKIYYNILLKRFDSKLKYFNPAEFISIYHIDSMDGFQFEDFLEKLFKSRGYIVEKTNKTGDQGADLFIEKFGEKIVIQAKNYTGNVGNASVQQALSAKSFFSCDQAMVITNSYFTQSAKELAEAVLIKLLDREDLINYLEDYNQALIEQFNF